MYSGIVGGENALKGWSMCFFRSQTAVFHEVAYGSNFMVAAQRVIAAVWNGERHFLASKLHLQVIVLGFIACAA